MSTTEGANLQVLLIARTDRGARQESFHLEAAPWLAPVPGGVVEVWPGMKRLAAGAGTAHHHWQGGNHLGKTEIKI